jgi:hypothetical protein
VGKSEGNWFNSDNVSATCACCEHRVRTYVRADIYEEVTGTQRMKHEPHILELVKTTIDISGCARHSGQDKESSIVHEGYSNST